MSTALSPSNPCTHTDSAVVDSRPSGRAIRRRRKCVSCGYRWTTYERPEDSSVDRAQLLRRMQKTLGSLQEALDVVRQCVAQMQEEAEAEQ